MKNTSTSTSTNTVLDPFISFIKSETFSGILLIGVTLIAILLANSAIGEHYFSFWETPVQFGIGTAILQKPLFYWINDGLMAIFFFVIGLEIKRELTVGELSNLRKASLPVFAAIGGILTPAIIYYAVNYDTPYANGWAVPVATDIAFSLGVLALLGKRIPLNLKIFLTALAIVDDLGAVLAIAIFYTSEISFIYLGIGLTSFAIMSILNVAGVRNVLIYIIIGFFGLWFPFLLSGVHATIAGVLAAFAIPLSKKIDAPLFKRMIISNVEKFESIADNNKRILSAKQMHIVGKMKNLCESSESPLQRLEDHLHPVAIYVIMPIFALANTGVIFSSETMTSFWGHSVSLGIILGLVFGKLIGISFFSWIAVKLGLASLPKGVSWMQIIGIAMLAGIGFTMSLFISDLAFHGESLVATSKVAIFVASAIAGIAGYIILRVSSPETADAEMS